MRGHDMLLGAVVQEDAPVGWCGETEKLLTLVTLNDSLGPTFSDRAGEAFFRAFIVECRATHALKMRMRWR